MSAFSLKEKLTRYSPGSVILSAGSCTVNVPRESGARAGASNEPDAIFLPSFSSSHAPSKASADVKPKRFQSVATPVAASYFSTTRLRWTWPTSTSFAETLRSGSTTPLQQNGPSFGSSSKSAP